MPVGATLAVARAANTGTVSGERKGRPYGVPTIARRTLKPPSVREVARSAGGREFKSFILSPSLALLDSPLTEGAKYRCAALSLAMTPKERKRVLPIPTQRSCLL